MLVSLKQNILDGSPSKINAVAIKNCDPKHTVWNEIIPHAD